MRIWTSLRATWLLWRAGVWRSRGLERTGDAKACHDRADALERAAASLMTARPR